MITTAEIIAFVIGLLGAILTVLNIIDKAVVLKAKNNEPFNALVVKVEEHDIKIKEIESSLLHGNDRFRDQEEVNEVLLHSILALIEFEMQYCIMEHKEMSKGLEKAKEDLNSFLARK